MQLTHDESLQRSRSAVLEESTTKCRHTEDAQNILRILTQVICSEVQFWKSLQRSLSAASCRFGKVQRSVRNTEYAQLKFLQRHAGLEKSKEV
ncbi:CLUMA_CG011414, isoform A [Clunio marinus]|uniref:CLUMA_CG011414, isoform A n=1 Tax=Clunio marinus TaxID=568069 RepID=A0A1J1ICN4_9DIPT|nr:CLUMA_CG011414, isoform A [Clunio marinus]